MAAIPMVISEVLCYINNKYGKFDNKRLTSVIYDFYNADKISEAKDVLLNEVEKLNLNDEVWTRPRQRRESDINARVMKDIKELFSLWNFLDEKNLIGMLPKFVVSDLSLVPTAKLDDGDVHLILQKLDKVEMANIELRKSVNNFRTTFPRVAVGASRRTSGSGPSQHGINTPEPNKSETETHPKDVDNLVDDWMIVESRSTKRARHAFQLADQPPQSSQTSIDGRQSQPAANGYSNALKSTPYGANKKSVITRIIGKSKSLIGGQSISGVKDLTRKRVFLVGNLNHDCTDDVLKEYVTGIGVRVISIFPARSKFRDNCFRVCINSLDVNTFCDGNNWPENVSIRNWIHKKSSEDTIIPPQKELNSISEPMLISSLVDNMDINHISSQRWGDDPPPTQSNA